MELQGKYVIPYRFANLYIPEPERDKKLEQFRRINVDYTTVTRLGISLGYTVRATLKIIFQKEV